MKKVNSLRYYITRKLFKRAGHVATTGETRYAYKNMVKNRLENGHLEEDAESVILTRLWVGGWVYESF
jgi:hypothetical protein